MKSSLFGVISVYDADPRYLFPLLGESVVFDQSTKRLADSGALNGVVNRRDAPHVGHDLKNNLDWVYENYENLPPVVAFLKGNTVPRHVSSVTALKNLLDRRILTPLWQESEKTSHNSFRASQLGPNLLLEENSSWYLQGPRVFARYEDLLRFVFDDPVIPRFVPFAPGGNYLVPAENLKNAPKEVYAFLSHISSYKFFPPEAWAVERLLWTLWTSSEKFHPRFKSATRWRQELPQETEADVGFTIARRIRKRLVRAILEADSHFDR